MGRPLKPAPRRAQSFGSGPYLPVVGCGAAAHHGGIRIDRSNRNSSVVKSAAGEVKPGFQTPSMAFGADFILEIEGVRRRI